MKLHLPVLLRKAIIACMLAVVSSFSPTAAAAVLTLGTGDSLSLDYADDSTIPNLNNGTLQLSGGALLELLNCGSGDGKTYTLATGVSTLLDSEDHALTLSDSNNAASLYFDATQPGSGFWKDGTLQLVDGNLQMILHNRNYNGVTSPTLSARRTNGADFQYARAVTARFLRHSPTTIAQGGAIYEAGSTFVTLSYNGNVEFYRNTASSSGTSSGSSAQGGAIYGDPITLSNNGNIEFRENTVSTSDSRASGGAISGDVTMNNNGSVVFIGNAASQSSSISTGDAFGGAIHGSIVMINNGSVEFIENTASSSSSSEGGAIDGTSITIEHNGSVEFIGNRASSSYSYSSSTSAEGGAIWGNMIAVTDNDSVVFSKNTASAAVKSSSSSSNNSPYSSAEGAAIYVAGDLRICNNDSVLFEKNAEVENGSYLLRSIYYTGGSADVISLSAPSGKTIEFRDSIYISGGGTLNLNADYTDAAGNVHKQQGDILFTGAYTAAHLAEVKGSAGTESEILNSQTSEVKKVTILHAGRLCIEDGAVYQGYGITAKDDSGSTVRVKNAELSHEDYQLTINSGTSLELAGENTISGKVQVNNGGTLFFDGSEENGMTVLTGSLTLGSGISYALDSESSWMGENHVLLWVDGRVTGAESGDVIFCGNSSFTWLDNALIWNYNADTAALYYKGDIALTSRQTSGANYQYYHIFSARNFSAYSKGGAIDGGDVTLSNNRSVELCENSVSGSSSAYGGTICAAYAGRITLSNNGSVIFERNTASGSSEAYGGAIAEYSSSGAITLSNNGSVIFERNTASGSSEAYGGAIFGDSGRITLSNNGSVKFEGNMARAIVSRSHAYGGAIFSDVSQGLFSEVNLSICNNDTVLFEKNAEIFYGSYRLRSIYVRGDVVLLSAAAGKSIEFRDSIYINSRTLNLNADYTDGAGNIHKQQGDILFTGGYTAEHLAEMKGSAGTASEILNSQTSEVHTVTNLYGGRLRVEDGAIYKGCGITAHEGSGATVRVKDAELSHDNYLTFNTSTTLELAGNNKISGFVKMQEGSTLLFDGSEGKGITILTGTFLFASGASYALDSESSWEGENHILMAVQGRIVSADNQESLFWDSSGFTWVGELLVWNYNETTADLCYKGDFALSTRQTEDENYQHYRTLAARNLTHRPASSSSASGGAIYGNVTLSNNGSVVFEGNTACSTTSSASGGAIYGSVTLSNNGSVEFCGNTASSGTSYADGGAIRGLFGTITLSNNESVVFSGNKACTTSSYHVACGGAIDSDWDLSICNNDAVLFEKNVEVRNGTYRLRSIYAEGSSVVSFSSPQDKSIEFRDSIYINSGVSFHLNSDYMDAAGNGIKQQGDVIFTGAYTEAHLAEIKGAPGTEKEILDSRTSEVCAMTNLHGGRLRVEDGAIYKGRGITAMENSGAALWMRDAQLNHAGYDMQLNAGTTFGLRGCNETTVSSLNMAVGSTLTFELSESNKSTAVLTHTGALTIAGAITLNIAAAEETLSFGQYKLVTVSDKSSVSGEKKSNLLISNGSFTHDDLVWVGNTLCFNYSGQQLSISADSPYDTYSPGLPDEPVTPDEPENPDEPVTPDEPENPDEPVTPDEPEIPDTPVTPDEPEIPDTPVTPDEPEIPDTPVTPDEPEIPDTPVTPDEPEIPDTPVTPDEPVIPDTPVTPEEPENPDALKKFRPASPVLTSKEINEKTEVILTSKGNMTLEGKISAGAISVNTDKNLTFKSNKKNPGALSGSGKLTKRGNGTLTLNDGNSSWTGDTYLYAGTIKVKGTSSLGKGEVYVKGGVLNLGSKAIANDIVQSASAAIKSGKKFTGSYALEKGELLKGSTLNIVRTATLEGGTVNGTLTGNGTATVTGNVKLGDKGKITTKALTLDEDATLTTSAKGLSSKATTLTIGENALFSLGGKMTVDSLKLNGGELKTTASKPAAMTVKNNMELTGATLTTNGKVTTNKLTLNESTMTIKGAKAQNLTVKQGLTLGSGSSLRLNGKLSAGSLTIKSGGTLTMSGSKPVTLKVKGALTLNSGSSIIMDYDFVQGKTYKLLTFGTYSGTQDYYSIFGVDADDCTITNTGKALTLTVTGKWNPQTQQKAVSAETPVVSAAKNNPVADALVQSNWGQLEASRAFVNAMANRSMAVQLGNGERAVWASAIGASSRHSSAGGHAGADTNVSGGAFGLETQVGRASLLGMALGNSWTRVSAHGFGTIEQDTTHLGLYGQTNWRSGVTADWSAAYGRSDSETMGSDWSQKNVQLDGRVSYNHALNASTVLSPFAGMQYYASDSATVEGTDTGSLQNLRAEIGVAASRRVGKFGVYGEIALHQDIARNKPTVSMEGVRYTGMNPGRTGLNFTVGASYELSDKWSVNASYTGEFVENANAHSANVGVTYKF